MNFQLVRILNVDSFSPGQLVNIRGKSIGKGFLAIKNIILLEVQ
jgi:ribosomal protein L3